MAWTTQIFFFLLISHMQIQAQFQDWLISWHDNIKNPHVGASLPV